MLRLIALLAFALSSQTIAAKPNILFIFTDDHAIQALGAYNGRLADVAKTPHLDQLAADGMRFDRAFVTNSICAPSRAVVLTGRYSHLNGQQTNGDTFDGAQETYPKLLRTQGYTTALIGKWHLKSRPTGFDHYEVLKGQGAYYNPMMIGENGNKTYTGYTTDIITDLSLQWLQQDRDASKPFMLMCQHKAPHGRWEPALRHLMMYDEDSIPEPETLFDDYSGRCDAARQHAMGIATDMNPFRLMFKYSSKHTPEQLKVFDAYYRPRNEAFDKHEGVRTDRYKLIRFYELDQWELFDLEKDPHEMTSVYDDPAYASIRRDMTARLKRQRGVLQVPAVD